MENLAAPWIRAAISRDRILPYPVAAQVQVSWLAATDLGAYVGSALRRPDLAGRSFDVGGPEALDGPALARALSQVCSEPIRYLTVAPLDLAHQLTPQLGATVAHGIARNYEWIAKRSDTTLFTNTSEELARDLRCVPSTVTQWARTQPWASAPTSISTDPARSAR